MRKIRHSRARGNPVFIHVMSLDSRLRGNDGLALLALLRPYVARLNAHSYCSS
jgi:hypothetical protein